ncbi:acyl- n-acyltransferase [Trichoderma cornu-damae]|uniref:Glucosamine 6-phosphate N-acetyltransferase n=1 Tax=Trichoderma cornu-damae TaxID=654480 RepID=A0A9P8TXV5_9HYPO|nr:acyl- n-acyltransferase [Trichoderma cornu-damae]
MSAQSPIFPASLLSSEAAAALPEGFAIRPLERGDYAKGFLECLRDLTWMDNLTEQAFNERYDEMDTGGKGPYYYLVIEHESQIVGTGAVIVEKKFIQNRTIVGHIEEICISKEYQRKKLGFHMLNALNSVAKNVGCRKTTLNCSEHNIAFYRKCGFEVSGTEMTREFKEEKEA